MSALSLYLAIVSWFRAKRRISNATTVPNSKSETCPPQVVWSLYVEIQSHIEFAQIFWMGMNLMPCFGRNRSYCECMCCKSWCSLDYCASFMVFKGNKDAPLRSHGGAMSVLVCCVFVTSVLQNHFGKMHSLVKFMQSLIIFGYECHILSHFLKFRFKRNENFMSNCLDFLTYFLRTVRVFSCVPLKK